MKKLLNKAQRECFLSNYEDWELWRTIPELDYKIYRYICTNGAVFLVSEYQHIVYDYISKKSVLKTGIKYHMILEPNDDFATAQSIYNGNEFKTFNPCGCSMGTIAAYMTKNREMEF